MDAIREVIERASVFTDQARRSSVETAVIARERLQSTGIGGGVAVAHGEVAHVAQVTIALGISRGGIPFDSVDGRPVHLLFVFATPPDQRQEYLQALCTIARLVKADFFDKAVNGNLSSSAIQERLCKAFGEVSQQLDGRGAARRSTPISA